MSRCAHERILLEFLLKTSLRSWSNVTLYMIQIINISIITQIDLLPADDQNFSNNQFHRSIILSQQTFRFSIPIVPYIHKEIFQIVDGTQVASRKHNSNWIQTIAHRMRFVFIFWFLGCVTRYWKTELETIENRSGDKRTE